MNDTILLYMSLDIFCGMLYTEYYYIFMATSNMAKAPLIQMEHQITHALK